MTKTKAQISTERRLRLLKEGIREVRGIEQPIELHKEIKKKIKELYPASYGVDLIN